MKPVPPWYGLFLRVHFYHTAGFYIKCDNLEPVCRLSVIYLCVVRYTLLHEPALNMKTKTSDMNITARILTVSIAAAWMLPSSAADAPGALDPSSVVEKWSDFTGSPRIIDINFSDESWPSTWAGETGRDCPSFDDGGYVNAIIDVAANGDGGVKYPVLFHNCTFANRTSYNGYAGTTAAFAKAYYLNASVSNYNDWKQTGHTVYLEDNIRRNSKGLPEYGEAGFVQMCRDAARTVNGRQTSMHGWVEIDHIPYVDRVQWSWSSTAWGRGIKCDVRIGDGDWTPLVWMASERQKNGYTVYSDQGYFMENVIDARDVSLRWRVWDGDDPDNPVQPGLPNAARYPVDPMAMQQAPRLHKVRIYGDELTAQDAEYARKNPVGDVGELSDLGGLLPSGPDKAPDADAPLTLLCVSPDGSADHTTVQAAIDAVPDGHRGIIYIAPGVYDENIYAGRKDSHDKFISLIGEDASTTVLRSSVSRGAGNEANSYLDCAALNVFVPRFYAENLTIANVSGDVGQAEALYTAGDAHIFRNCVISGFQDTYKANSGARGYFADCLIEGCTDFIYDGGLEWFEDCEIRCLKAKGGYVTAPATSGSPMSKVLFPELSSDSFCPGLFFRNCRVTAEDGAAASGYTLGRPWGERSGAMYIGCTLGNHISAAGWTDWGGRGATASFYEYGSLSEDGRPVDVSRRASFSRQATQAEVEAYMTPEFMFGHASDVPFDYARILGSAASPMNFRVDGSLISWDGDDLAAGYLIYKSGRFVAFVDTPEYQTAGDADGYTVRTVSRYGVMSPAVAAREASRLKAFATAEGFGKYATGGRGGRVVKVTSLADDGSDGTLRSAFTKYPGEPITIVFEVSGDIALTRELRVSRADWTLAGQTAPGDGVVITRNKVNFGGSQNFIVRNVRFRIGQKDVSGQIQAENACGAENCSNYIFDHCSFGWSVEENMNTADCHFLTVQYCIVHEGLYNAGHSKGARGYGCQWGGSPATYHHNLLAHNTSRSPRFNGARGEDYVVFMEYINNVNYNYGGTGGCYGGENTADIAEYNGLNSAHECNFMSNYYRPGATSDKTTAVFVNSSHARSGATSWAPAQWYLSGNVAHGIASVTEDNARGVTAEGYRTEQVLASDRIVPERPYYRYTVAGTVGNYIPSDYMLTDIESAADAYATVIARAGCIRRDRVESRVAADARDGAVTYGGKTKGIRSGIIDTEADAEGFFEWSDDYEAAADSDGDGMPDEWERTVGLDPAVADNNRLNADGYTALEVYLGSLMGENLSDDFSTASVADAVATSVGMSYETSAAQLKISGAPAGCRVTVYTSDGRVAMASPVASETVSLARLSRGVYIVCLDGPSVAPRVLRIAR